ncbi:MAG TPA: glycosyltransferase family 9 protein [Ktedonobacterales bacterium]
MTRTSSAPQNPHEILVTALCPIGDTIFLTPALALVRRRYPQAHITVAAAPANQGILADNPDRDALVIVHDPAKGFHPRRIMEGARALHELRPDLIINFSTGGAIVTALAGLRSPRLGLKLPPWFALVGARGDQTYRERHAVDHYFTAIEDLAPPPSDPADRIPRFYLGDEDREQAKTLLADAPGNSGAMVVTMHVGGDGFNGRKRWAPSRFARVANGLIERFGARVALVGGPADLPTSEETARLISGPVAMLAGKTSLKVTGALIEASALFIGNDSSPLHIAAALGTPSIGIYGPSDWKEFAPVARPGYRGRMLHSDLPCSPCFRFVGNRPLWQINTCYTYACLKAISAPRVLETAAELLAEGLSGSDAHAEAR